MPEFTAVLDEMTRNTYVLVIWHVAYIGEPKFHFHPWPVSLDLPETAAVKLNIKMARSKFEELQGESLTSA